MQANDNTFNDKIAFDVLEAGLGILLSGSRSPLMREGGVQYLHAFGFVDGVECVHPDCM